MAKNNKNNNELNKFLIEQIKNNGIQLRDYRNLKDKNRTLERFNENPYKETKRAFELEKKREQRIKNKNGTIVDGIVIKESEAIQKAKEDEQIVLSKIDLSPIETKSNNEEVIEILVEKWIQSYREKGISLSKEDIENARKWFKENYRKTKQTNLIDEAQDKLEERREELNKISKNTEGFEEDIDLYDKEKKIKFKTNKEYEQAFYIGEVVEQALYDMCSVARTYSWTVPDRIFFVEETVKESKIKYGEKTFYNNLWNKQGETLENCQTIVMSSKGQDVSRQVQRVKTLLLDIPYDEIEIDD